MKELTENIDHILNVMVLTTTGKEKEAKEYISKLTQEDIIGCLGILIGVYYGIQRISSYVIKE